MESVFLYWLRKALSPIWLANSSDYTFLQCLSNALLAAVLCPQTQSKLVRNEAAVRLPDECTLRLLTSFEFFHTVRLR
jgi:hypothetical protein